MDTVREGLLALAVGPCRLFFRMAPGLTCEIVDLETKAEYRGLGYGKAAVGKLIASHARPAGVKTVYALARGNNQIAKEFYLAVGFRKSGELSWFYRDGGYQDAAVYVIDLS